MTKRRGTNQRQPKPTQIEVSSQFAKPFSFLFTPTVYSDPLSLLWYSCPEAHHFFAQSLHFADKEAEAE
jgi:hypothetical protein